MKNNITKEDLYDISTISSYFFTEHLGNEFDEFIDNKAELKEIKKNLKIQIKQKLKKIFFQRNSLIFRFFN